MTETEKQEIRDSAHFTLNALDECNCDTDDLLRWTPMLAKAILDLTADALEPDNQE